MVDLKPKGGGSDPKKDNFEKEEVIQKDVEQVAAPQQEETLFIPTEYQSTRGGIVVQIDQKFVTIKMNMDIAEHIGAHRFGKEIHIKFLKDGSGAPDITAYRGI